MGFFIYICINKKMTIKEQILGGNKTTPAVFTDNLSIGAIYTFKNDVYCLHQGEDFDFDEVGLKDQQKILDAIVNKKIYF